MKRKRTIQDQEAGTNQDVIKGRCPGIVLKIAVRAMDRD